MAMNEGDERIGKISELQQQTEWIAYAPLVVLLRRTEGVSERWVDDFIRGFNARNSALKDTQLRQVFSFEEA